METQETSSLEPFHEKKSTKKKNKIAKRFTNEQIKSLESFFELDNKLETKKKFEIAKDLGLEPRQVAIWFQNRRARWKSKQIEKEYKVLKSNYDNLYEQFDDLKREKQSLQMQLQELSHVLKNLDKVNLNDLKEDDEEKNLKYLEKKEQEQVFGKWCNFSSNGLIFDQSSNTSNWWEN